MITSAGNMDVDSEYISQLDCLLRRVGLAGLHSLEFVKIRENEDTVTDGVS